MPRGITLLALLPIVIAVSAADFTAQARAKDPPPPARTEELWQQPSKISAQDAFHGPWGSPSAPDPTAKYRFIRSKRSGVNPAMTVVDPLSREWSVKQPLHDVRSTEERIEVVLSRVLSAVGYYQPPVYFLPSFTLADTFGARHEPGGRFRLNHPDLKEGAAWNWAHNPFVGTRPHQGLLVILIMFNNADLRTSNNVVYEHKTASGSVERWYVVRGLGDALGTTSRFGARQGEADQFAALPFLSGMSGDKVRFGYTGRFEGLIRDRITADDVRWACGLLTQLSAAQWYDAFRAGGYDRAAAEPFIQRLREKIAEGLALTTA